MPKQELWSDKDLKVLKKLYKECVNGRPITFLRISEVWGQMKKAGEVDVNRNAYMLERKIKSLIKVGELEKIDRLGNIRTRGKSYFR